MVSEQEQAMRFEASQQQRQIDADPQTIYADGLREEKAANILAQLDPENLLNDIEHRIRGELKDKFTGEWKRINNDNVVSEKLVSNFMSFLGSIVNQNTVMSNYSQGEVNAMLENIIEFIKQDFVINKEDYGLHDNYSEYNRIGFIILNSCSAVFKRSLNGSESRRIFKMLKVSESVGGKKGGKLVDNFKFW
jgi:hypothetical protein